MTDRQALKEDLVSAAHALSALGLVTAFGHVSARYDDHMLITPAIDLGEAATDTILEIALDADELPPGTPGEVWIHFAVYRERPDVMAVARAMPEAAFALGALTALIVPLHGQGAMLGEAVPVHDAAHLMRTRDIAESAARSLGNADAVVLRGNGAVTTGTTPGQTVARMWLLDASCRVHLAARPAGTSTPLSSEEIASWRAAAPPLLDRLWEHLRRGGGPPSGPAGKQSQYVITQAPPPRVPLNRNGPGL